jgi:hypothetical protein
MRQKGISKFWRGHIKIFKYLRRRHCQHEKALFEEPCREQKCYFGTATTHLPPKPPPWRPHRYRPFSTTTTPPPFKLRQTILPYPLDCLPWRLFQRYSLSVLTSAVHQTVAVALFLEPIHDDPTAIAHSLPYQHRHRTNRSLSNLATLSLADSPIHSVRFMKDKAYVVTFEQKDPFIVIDLSNATDPRPIGELEVWVCYGCFMLLDISLTQHSYSWMPTAARVFIVFTPNWNWWREADLRCRAGCEWNYWLDDWGKDQSLQHHRSRKSRWNVFFCTSVFVLPLLQVQIM